MYEVNTNTTYPPNNIIQLNANIEHMSTIQYPHHECQEQHLLELLRGDFRTQNRILFTFKVEIQILQGLWMAKAAVTERWP